MIKRRIILSNLLRVSFIFLIKKILILRFDDVVPLD